MVRVCRRSKLASAVHAAAGDRGLRRPTGPARGPACSKPTGTFHVVGARGEQQRVPLGAELVRLLRVVHRVDSGSGSSNSTIDGVKTSNVRHDVRSGWLGGGGGVLVPPGGVHCWFELSAQAQIWTWVPEPPKPVSSRHLPEFGFTSSPVGLRLPEPGRLVPVAGVELDMVCRGRCRQAEMSRHLPSDCTVAAGGVDGPLLRAGAVAGVDLHRGGCRRRCWLRARRGTGPGSRVIWPVVTAAGTNRRVHRRWVG